MAINRQQILAAHERQQRAALLNETSPSAIAEIVTPEDLVALDAYQQVMPLDSYITVIQPETSEGKSKAKPQEVIVEGLLSSPLSPDFMTRYSGLGHLFTHNKFFHTDRTEDIIAVDGIIGTLLQRKSAKASAAGEVVIMDALRARRTVVATLYALGMLVLPAPETATQRAA